MTEPHILIVEDDPSLRDVVTEALLDDGYRVTSANNGATALELARELRPDLVILDLMMPQMNGEEFCAKVRRMEGLADLPIIVVSAARGTEEVGARLGAAAALKKPFDLFELTGTVEGILAP
jgi:DNA-binding response OmpR family regulator